MFVIVQNNYVVLGPMVWNRFRFQNFLLEECEVTFTLDSRNDSETPVVVSDEIKILPTATSPNPDYNPKTQILHGPFWAYTDSLATSSYQVVDKSVEAVKNELIAVAANQRWIKTSNTVPVTINSTEYKFDTTTQTTSALQQAITANVSSLNWKLKGEWITLSSSDVSTVYNAIVAHTQTCFDWEHSKVAEINNCTTLAELDALVIVTPFTPPNLPGI